MRILLDENLDWRLCKDLTGHRVESVSRIGWAGIKNGELLERAVGQFDVLITMDGSLPHQQNLSRFQIAVVGLRARSNRLADTRPLMGEVLTRLASLRNGTYTVIPADTSGLSE